MNTNKLTIRVACLHDINEIEDVYRKRVLYNDAHHIHQWILEDVCWNTLSKLYTIENCYVGMYHHHIACVMMIVDVDQLYWPNAPKKEALYLHKICVHPMYRNMGFADRLIQYFITKGKQEGYPCVRLDVRAHKTKLRRMYERNGFLLKDIKQIHEHYKTALYEYIL